MQLQSPPRRHLRRPLLAPQQLLRTKILLHKVPVEVAAHESRVVQYKAAKG